MITCKKSTEWIIKKEEGTLSLKQNLQLLSHLAICSFCRLFVNQSSFINKALKKSVASTPSLSPLDKEKMLAYVQSKIKE